MVRAGEVEENMDLAALMKDGEVAWLHAADIPADMRPYQGGKPPAAPRGPNVGSRPPAAHNPPAPAGAL